MLEGTAEFIHTKQQRSVSIIIPTYNESQNILKLIDSIRNNLSHGLDYEIIIVDDDSPDGTGKIVLEKYARIENTNVVDPRSEAYTADLKNNKIDNEENNLRSVVKVINRAERNGLVPAILQGIGSSMGNYVLIMDADFSHPPELITKIIHELDLQNDIVIASRYIKGGSIEGWPFKRRMISLGATKLAQYGLGMKEIRDPMSGFFAMKRRIIEDIKISTGGYKILLEILAKANYKARIKEIPYTFSDRKAGKSKLDNSVMLSYVKAVCQLYQHGHKSSNTDTELKKFIERKSVRFLSKAARFYTVGASGLLLNYLISLLLSNGIVANFDYLQATVAGIVASNISNFLLNKFWTFEDRDFSLRKTLKQYGFFAAIISAGAVAQLGALYLFLESGFSYELSLIIAVALASGSNFLFNKKLTFGEKVWA
jgi:dolichol-phosphate mannosyltransferase